MKLEIKPPLLVEWNDMFNLGIPELDVQHRQIVDYTNALYLARFNQDEKVVEKVLWLLVKYTRTHMDLEEELMEKAGFPDLIQHRLSHLTFINVTNNFVLRHYNGEDIAAELQEKVNHWIYKHIMHDDMSFKPLVIEMLKKNAEIREAQNRLIYIK